MILDTNSELLLPYLLGYNSLLLPGFLETSSVAARPSPWPRRRPKKQTLSPLLIAHLRGAKTGLRDSRLVAPAAGASSRNAASAARARALHACRLRVCRRRRPFSSDAEMLDARLDRNVTSAISNVVVVDDDSEGDGGVVYFCVPPLNHFSHSFFLSLQ